MSRALLATVRDAWQDHRQATAQADGAELAYHADALAALSVAEHRIALHLFLGIEGNAA